MSGKTETTPFELKGRNGSKITEIAEKIEKDLKFGEGGTASLPADYYDSLLPSHLNSKDAAEYREHDANILNGLGLALGRAGTAAMKKDKKLDQVSAEIQVGKNSIGAVFQRSKQVPDGNGGQKTKYGVLTPSFIVSGTEAGKGSLKKIRDHLAAQAAEVLG